MKGGEGRKMYSTGKTILKKKKKKLVVKTKNSYFSIYISGLGHIRKQV